MDESSSPPTLDELVRLHSIYLNFTPYRKTTSGGERASRSGQIRRKRSRCFEGIINLMFPATSASMTYAYRKLAKHKPTLHNATELKDSATTITGSPAGDFRASLQRSASFWRTE